MGRLLRALGALVAVLAILTVGALVYRCIAQYRHAQAVAIRTPNGIDEAGFVALGGIDQWVTIRGEDLRNPVILIVGGVGADGPGTVLSPFVDAFRPWERDFTVVQWDQQGAGKTFARAGGRVPPGLGVDRLAGDGLALTRHLRRRLGKSKIILLGTGFGSTVAVRMAMADPASYAAYVGAGQIVSPRRDRERFGYDRLLARATAAGDQESLADLRVSGPWPFRPPRDPKKLAAFVKVARRYHAPNPPHQTWDVLTAPHWSLAEARAIPAGMTASEVAFGRAWGEGFDYASLGPELQIPVFVIQGDDNTDAPIPQAQAWLARIHAPAKEVVVIKGAGNHGLQTHSQAFLEALRVHVLPIALATH
ncbi:alpha/beta fold hydrolase [Phenylobacterium aquaticum]|uniref:alpha/beta fold hydrolase n=1 Tax=Phenylobacterium aquaticum TaxID=1763816 RepID=UPI0026F34911|nr:alpha/beta hydrolase [Phenylobacterium aquaticum]